LSRWRETPRGTYPTTAANTIEIRIEKIAQLFHSLDPFPYREKDLDNDVEEFIVGWARELPPDKPLRIIVHLPETEASTPEAHEFGAAFAQYFGYRARVIGLDLNELFRVADERWPLVSRYSPSPSSLAKQSSTLRRVRSVVSLKRACFFGWVAN
jgi:hypothetical protein